MELWAVGVLLMVAAPDRDATRELDNAIASIKNQEENTQSFSLEYSYQDHSRMFVDPQREQKTEKTCRLLGDGIERRYEEILPGETFDARSDFYEITVSNGEKQFRYSPKRRSGGFGTGLKLRFPVTYFDFLHGYPTGLTPVLQENRAKSGRRWSSLKRNRCCSSNLRAKTRGKFGCGSIRRRPIKCAV